jgi:hypothetical protein
MRFDCLVVSPDGTRVWLLPDGDGHILPSAECDAGWLPNAVAEIQDHFRRRHGLDVIVLRELLRDNRDEGEVSVCELETRGSSSTQTGEGEWHHAAQTAAVLRDSAHRTALTRWLAGEGVERHVAAWQRRGWFDEARSWIVESLATAGLQVTGPVMQVKAGWNGSAVLRVPTTGGLLYFKASPPRLPGEPAVLHAFPARWSRHVPELMVPDPERCWMLVREADGQILDPEDARSSAEAARLYAHIQIDQAAEADRWCSLGCPDRGLETMEREIPGLLIEIPAGLAAAGVVSAAERDEIASFVPHATALCRELAGFAIPARSIHHEDFRSGNVLRRRDGTLVILDWNETVVAHPFFSAQRYLWFILPPEGATRHEILPTESDALRRAVRDAYLEPFTCFEPPDRLLEAFHLSSLLGPIYDALRFRAGSNLDQVFARGLGAEERRIARDLIDHMLEVRRAARAASGQWALRP